MKKQMELNKMAETRQAQMDPPSTTNAFVAVEETGKRRLRTVAKIALDPATRAVVGGQAFAKNLMGDSDVAASIAVLREQIKEIGTGNLQAAEASLLAQANTLDLIFNGLVRKAAQSDTLVKYEMFMRLALKAQSQCRASLATLAEIKHPRTTAFIRQQNVGLNQQVNNGVVTSTPEKIVNPTNELLMEVD
jgi:hypothetical protein